MLGYRLENGHYVIVPEEADIVRRIYRDYLAGLGYTAIAKALNNDGIPSVYGKLWTTATLTKILSNYNYTGNLLLQETYLQKYDSLTKRYEAAAAELERLQSLRNLRSQQDRSMTLFIRTLKKQPEVLDYWDDTIWTVMVEKATINKEGQITFVFYNGSRVTLPIELLR